MSDQAATLEALAALVQGNTAPTKELKPVPEGTLDMTIVNAYRISGKTNDNKGVMLVCEGHGHTAFIRQWLYRSGTTKVNRVFTDTMDRLNSDWRERVAADKSWACLVGTTVDTRATRDPESPDGLEWHLASDGVRTMDDDEADEFVNA